MADTKIAKILADNLRALRKMRGYSQYALAKAIGVSGTSVQGYEYQTRWPAPEILEKLAAALEVPVTALFGAKVVEIQPKMKLTDALKTLQDAIQGRLDRETRLSHIPDDLLAVIANMAPSEMETVKSVLAAGVEGAVAQKEILAAKTRKKKPVKSV